MTSHFTGKQFKADRGPRVGRKIDEGDMTEDDLGGSQRAHGERPPPT